MIYVSLEISGLNVEWTNGSTLLLDKTDRILKLAKTVSSQLKITPGIIKAFTKHWNLLYEPASSLLVGDRKCIKFYISHRHLRHIWETRLLQHDVSFTNDWLSRTIFVILFSLLSTTTLLTICVSGTMLQQLKQCPTLDGSSVAGSSCTFHVRARLQLWIFLLAMLVQSGMGTYKSLPQGFFDTVCNIILERNVHWL